MIPPSPQPKALLRALAAWRDKLPARLLVGVSGGADSVALLHLLVEKGCRPHVCHLNHRWRGAEADADAEFVRALAGKLKLPVTIKARKVGPTEDAARKARHEFFHECAKATGIHTLALAHTADDQAETILLRLIRGAGPTGLAGMAAEREFGKLHVVRPLLNISRSEIVEYLQARGLAWREDASNRDVRFLRNRVRHVLLPLLEREFNPGIRRVLLRTAEVLRAEAAADEPTSAQRREIRRRLGPLGFKQVEEVRKRIGGEWEVKLTGRTVVEELGLVLECADSSALFRKRQSASKLAHSKEECFDADALGRSLTIRTWRAGDRFQPLGMQKHKKLQDFFVDEKVPRNERASVPLLCAADGRIAWVVGYRIAESFKVTPETRHVVRLSCVRLAKGRTK